MLINWDGKKNYSVLKYLDLIFKIKQHFTIGENKESNNSDNVTEDILKSDILGEICYEYYSWNKFIELMSDNKI